jgi:hypothetical protein
MLLGSLGERRSEMESPYAQQWQARARELRTQAEQMISPGTVSLSGCFVMRHGPPEDTFLGDTDPRSKPT